MVTFWTSVVFVVLGYFQWRANDQTDSARHQVLSAVCITNYKLHQINSLEATVLS